MAYTYDDFVSAANSAGLMNRFSNQDLQVAQTNPEYGLSLLGLLQDNASATTEEQRLLATEAANQLRKSYGVYNTGNLDSDSAYASSYGSQINSLLDQAANYGSFNYANQDAYQGALDQLTNYGNYSYGNQNAYQSLLDSIVNQRSFSYDVETDPGYSAYKKQYLREGDRASANALAQASAASGGRASSYALSAAQQAANYYAGQLSDIIPTLEQNAYQKYLNDFSNRLSSLSALESDRAFDYENWMNQYSMLQNSLSALESDRAFDYENWLNQYSMLQNSLSNYQSQDATDYQRYLDAYNLAYQNQQNQLSQEQQAYENALALYQALGYATPEVAQALGISSSGTGSGATTSGGANGGTSGGSSGKTTAQTAQTAESGIPDNVLSALKSSYPSGKVTNQTYWNSLIALYGEKTLAAAGFSYGSPTDSSESGGNSSNSSKNSGSSNSSKSSSASGGGSSKESSSSKKNLMYTKG